VSAATVEQISPDLVERQPDLFGANHLTAAARRARVDQWLKAGRKVAAARLCRISKRFATSITVSQTLAVLHEARRGNGREPTAIGTAACPVQPKPQKVYFG